MRGRAVFLAAAIILAPLGAKAADLVVWWEKGYYDQEDKAVRETIAAFEQDAGKQVELVFVEQDELPVRIEAALETGRPPDFAFGLELGLYVAAWARDDRLADLREAVGAFSNLFDPDALDRGMWLDAKTGQKAAVRAAGRALELPSPRLDEPSGARGLHACGHSPRVGAVLVILVRPGPAGGAPSVGP